MTSSKPRSRKIFAKIARPIIQYWLQFVAAMFFLGVCTAAFMILFWALMPFFYPGKYYSDMLDSSSKFFPVEMAYYISSTMIFFISGFALLIAYSQSSEASHARRAAIYLEITRRVESKSVRIARRKLIAIQKRFADNPNQAHQHPSLKSFAGQVVKDLKTDHDRIILTDSECDTEFRKLHTILSFFEDVGVLVRHGHLKRRDVFEIMSSLIEMTENIFSEYIEMQQKLNGDRIYANALWLMLENRKYVAKGRAFSFPVADLTGYSNSTAITH
ncbi:DUF4760 domain-containing protein [Jiella sonneratiae]|uniref:DUF4760 domain-containing protein n=1 Tax=Jiella sonneratiae TaxID=2816856 RepID=A0ABS3J8C7_9HYPH|nr:hypothetical protein [Jiella sonneratiae]MBO0905922.1 hypothetical protein [Jiella sonneratiae]